MVSLEPRRACEIVSDISAMRHLLSKIPLRATIVLPFVAQISVAVGLIAWLSVRNGQQAVSEVADQLWEETTLHVIDNVTKFMDTPRHLVVDTVAFHQLDVANLRDPVILTRYLWHQMRSHDDLFITAVGYEDGTVVGVGTEADNQLVVRQIEPGQIQLHTYNIVGEGNRGTLLRADDFDVKKRPWYRKAVEAGQITWTDIYPNYAFPYLLISAVKPLYEPETGALLGVTNATVSLRGIDLYLERLKISPLGEVFIIEPSGQLVASSTKENLYRSLNDSGVESRVRLSALESGNVRVRRATQYLIEHFGDLSQIRERELFYFSPAPGVQTSPQLSRLQLTNVFVQGSSEIVQVTPFPDSYGLDWLVVVAVPEADFMQRIYANTRLTWVLCLAAFALATISGIGMSRWITRPLIQLNQKTKAIASQDLALGILDGTITSQGTREVRELATSFSRMVTHLQRSFRQMQVLNRSLAESESRLQQLLEALPVGTAVHDDSGRLIYLNQVGRALLQVTQTPETPADQLVITFQTFYAGTQKPFTQEDIPALRALNGETVYVDNMELRQQNRTLPIEVWASPIYNDQNQVAFAVAVFQDISDRKRTEEQLIYNAFHDSLTDLPNRTLLLKRLELAISRTQPADKYRFAVLFLDLDRFKVFNDSLGHLVGDQLLIHTSHRLRQVIRPVDLAARLGGDEFVVLLEDIDDVPSVIRTAEAIFTELQTPISIEGREVVLSTSIGIVLNTAPYHDANDLLRDADIALYRAKAKGKGCYEVFNAEMHTQALKRLQLENDLRQAISYQQLRVYYQPIFTIDRMELVGLEALVRWSHPTQGMILPADFMAVAEETGLIKDIDAWVLQNACDQLARWHRQFPQHRHLTISVNLSGQEFQGNRLVEDVTAVLTYTGLTANCLTLEITENVLVEDIDHTIEVLKALRKQGICISVDDFGTGYSSLSYLYNLPLDHLKIDKSFVGNMRNQGKNYKIVEAVIGLSNQLSIDAIAEGIEA